MRNYLQIAIIVILVIVAFIALSIFYGPNSSARLKSQAQDYARAIQYHDYQIIYNMLAPELQRGIAAYQGYIGGKWGWANRTYTRIRVVEVRKTDKTHGTIKISADFMEYGRASSNDFTSYWVFRKGKWYKTEDF